MGHAPHQIPTISSPIPYYVLVISYIMYYILYMTICGPLIFTIQRIKGACVLICTWWLLNLFGTCQIYGYVFLYMWELKKVRVELSFIFLPEYIFAQPPRCHGRGEYSFSSTLFMLFYSTKPFIVFYLEKFCPFLGEQMKEFEIYGVLNFLSSGWDNLV